MTKITLRIAYPERQTQEFSVEDSAWDLTPVDLLHHFIGLLRSAGYAEQTVADALAEIGDPEYIAPSKDEDE